jgi:hypothetical protein
MAGVAAKRAAARAAEMAQAEKAQMENYQQRREIADAADLTAKPKATRKAPRRRRPLGE